MVPIGARAYNGAGTNPEFMIAGITGLIGFLATGFYVRIYFEPICLN